MQDFQTSAVAYPGTSRMSRPAKRQKPSEQHRWEACSNGVVLMGHFDAELRPLGEISQRIMLELCTPVLAITAFPVHEFDWLQIRSPIGANLIIN